MGIRAPGIGERKGNALWATEKNMMVPRQPSKESWDKIHITWKLETELRWFSVLRLCVCEHPLLGWQNKLGRI